MNEKDKTGEPQEEQTNETKVIDEAMLEMSGFIDEMTDLDVYLVAEEEDFAMYAEKVTLDLPVQLDIGVLDDGQVVIGSSPPLYYVETTIMPVFHQLKVTIEKENTQTE